MIDVFDFWLKTGPNYTGILKAVEAARDGLPPRFIEVEEKTDKWMEFFLDAFFELDTERISGYGIFPIPVSRIRSYAARYGYEGELEEEFVYYLRAMDRHYMTYAQSKEKNKTKVNPDASTPWKGLTPNTKTR